MSGQSRTDSVMEALTNTVVGFVVSLGANLLIFPAFGVHTSLASSMGIVAAFTVVSIVRQYVLRRLFNGRSVWAAISGRR